LTKPCKYTRMMDMYINGNIIYFWYAITIPMPNFGMIYLVKIHYTFFWVIHKRHKMNNWPFEYSNFRSKFCKKNEIKCGVTCNGIQHTHSLSLCCIVPWSKRMKKSGNISYLILGYNFLLPCVHTYFRLQGKYAKNRREYCKKQDKQELHIINIRLEQLLVWFMI